MKTYKIWCFRHESMADVITVPDCTQFYCFNKDYSKSRAVSTSEGLVYNEHWTAVIPFTEDNIIALESYKQSLSLNIYILNKKYIILDLSQIYPLSRDWPETKLIPDIGDEYIRIRCMDMTVNADEYEKFANELDANLELSNEERQGILEEKFCPPVCYIKIHGFSKCGKVDITKVTLKSWLYRSDYFNVVREDIRIDSLFAQDTKIRKEESNKTEYNNKLNELLDNV